MWRAKGSEDKRAEKKERKRARIIAKNCLCACSKIKYCTFLYLIFHSRSQRPRSFLFSTKNRRPPAAPNFWACARVLVLKFSANPISQIWTTINRLGLPGLGVARGLDSLCWPKGSWPLGPGPRMLIFRKIYLFGKKIYIAFSVNLRLI